MPEISEQDLLKIRKQLTANKVTSIMALAVGFTGSLMALFYNDDLLNTMLFAILIIAIYIIWLKLEIKEVN